MKIFKVIIPIALVSLALAGCVKKETAPPNIVIIYADDMGYGDLNCQNPESKIPTPNLDQLASEGMRFTDAHSSSGICSPSRFALLTGMYHWRRQHGIVQAFGIPFFRETDITLPQLLKENGYATACIGKWHLGWNWEFKGKPTGPYPERKKNPWYYTVNDIDWSKPVAGGPLDRGFDYYFGDGTINFPPYTWIENDKLLEIPSKDIDMKNFGFETKEGEWEFRRGPSVEGWDPYKVLPTLTRKVVEYIDRNAAEARSGGKPLFLYMPLSAPHTPILPVPQWQDRSGISPYAELVYEIGPEYRRFVAVVGIDTRCGNTRPPA